MDIPHRTDQPRIASLEPADWDTGLREQLLGNRPPEMGDAAAAPFNIFKTLANHPKLASKFGVWGNQILFKSSLAPRDRELAILRVGWLCRATYEWHHHVAIGRDHAGMNDADIALARSGPVANSEAHDDVLLRAVDELVLGHFVSDATWALLARRFDQIQLIDLVFAVGQYTMVSMALNSFGVQLEDNYRGAD